MNSIGKPNTAGLNKEGFNRYRVWLFHFCRIVLGLVFVYASYDKILHPQAFALAVFQYQILPDSLINITALLLPWLELLLGLCLLAGFWLPGATVMGAGLLAVFLGSLVFNQIRGLDIHCGCFSTEITEGAAGIGTLLRDIAFLALAVYMLVYIFFLPGRWHSKKGVSSSLLPENDAST